MINPDGAFLVETRNDFGQGYTEEVVRDMFRVPTPTRANSMDLLRTQLLKLPLDALKSFDELIPEKPAGSFDTVPKAVDTILKALVDNPAFLTWQRFLEFLDQLKKDPGAVIGKIGRDMVEGLQTALDNLIKLVQDILENIWKGVGGLGDVIGGIFDPDKARKAMEELNRRIAEAVAEIIKSGGTVEQFSVYPNGQSLGSKWKQTYTSGANGRFGIDNGLAKFVSNIGLDGRRMRAQFLPGSPRTSNHRVDTVFASAPHVGNKLDFATYGNAFNEISARVSPDGNEKVFARLYGSFYQIGFNTVANGEVILGRAKFQFSPTAAYAIVCDGRTFSLWDGSRQFPPVVDGQGLSGLTDNHRGVGFEVGAGNDLSRPGGIAAFGFRDI